MLSFPNLNQKVGAFHFVRRRLKHFLSMGSLKCEQMLGSEELRQLERDEGPSLATCLVQSAQCHPRLQGHQANGSPRGFKASCTS